jgi:hypothetical protein
MSASGQPTRYEVRVEGLLDSHWAAWFEGLHLSNDGTQTVISGPLADQPALLSVRRLDSGDAGDGAPLLDPIRIPSLGHAPAGALPAMRERVLAAAEAAGRAPGELTWTRRSSSSR